MAILMLVASMLSGCLLVPVMTVIAVTIIIVAGIAVKAMIVVKGIRI
jgi:hypothetical protein